MEEKRSAHWDQPGGRRLSQGQNSTRGAKPKTSTITTWHLSIIKSPKDRSRDRSILGGKVRVFRRKQFGEDRFDDCMAEEAVSCELFSCPNSLLTGKNTGISRFRSYHSTDKLQPERRVAKNTQHCRQSEQGPIRETTGCQFAFRRSRRLAGPTTFTAMLMSPFFLLRRAYRVIVAYLRGYGT